MNGDNAQGSANPNCLVSWTLNMQQQQQEQEQRQEWQRKQRNSSTPLIAANAATGDQSGAGKEEFIAKHDTAMPKHAPAKIDVVAAALTSMSLEERERAFESLHGVSSTAATETPAFVLQNLQEFNLCLHMRLATRPSDPYQLALAQNPNFVLNPNFRLQFLRCEEFNVIDAVKRFIRHFEFKLRLWGLPHLTTDIQLKSFTESDQKLVANGGTLQVLPVRDTSGRQVVFAFDKYHRQDYKKENPEIFASQMFWYFLMTLTEDEETQRKGFVYVSYTLDFKPTFDEIERNVWWSVCAALNALPIRLTGMHYCYNQTHLRPIMSLISMGHHRNVRARLRTHFGTHQEVHYSLLSYGLPTEHLPVAEDGTLKSRIFHTRFLKYRKYREENPLKYRNALLVPGRFDVLLGRGRPNQLHYGNRRFLEILRQHYPTYDAAKRKDKNNIADAIVSLIKGNPAKFLIKDDNDIWLEASDLQAREKVCHGLRRVRELIGKMPDTPLQHFPRPYGLADQSAKTNSFGNTRQVQTKRLKLDGNAGVDGLFSNCCSSE